MPSCYVKVFSKTKKGGEEFYRDGYTDIRGKFDYVQSSGDKLKDVERFAILVAHPELGSKIMECDPPKDMQGSSGAGQSIMQAVNEQRWNRWEERTKMAQSKRKPLI